MSEHSENANGQARNIHAQRDVDSDEQMPQALYNIDISWLISTVMTRRQTAVSIAPVVTESVANGRDDVSR